MGVAYIIMRLRESFQKLRNCLNGFLAPTVLQQQLYYLNIIEAFNSWAWAEHWNVTPLLKYVDNSRTVLSISRIYSLLWPDKLCIHIFRIEQMCYLCIESNHISYCLIFGAVILKDTFFIRNLFLWWFTLSYVSCGLFSCFNIHQWLMY